MYYFLDTPVITWTLFIWPHNTRSDIKYYCTYSFRHLVVSSLCLVGWDYRNILSMRNDMLLVRSRVLSLHDWHPIYKKKPALVYMFSKVFECEVEPRGSRGFEWFGCASLNHLLHVSRIQKIFEFNSSCVIELAKLHILLSFTSLLL